jgi:hypothetical protein
MSTKFIKNKEDFVCQNCGTLVVGNGFTNHCPKCLFSLHVDNDPGDRANDCGGLMEPIGVETIGGQYDIIHRCKNCGKIKNNKTSKDDDIGGYLTSVLQ